MKPDCNYSEQYARQASLIIGAQKPGTVSPYRYLADHSGIVPASRKEFGYICNAHTCRHARIVS